MISFLKFDFFLSLKFELLQKRALQNLLKEVVFLNVYWKFILIKRCDSINKKSKFHDSFWEQPISVKAWVPSSLSWWAGWATRLWTLEFELYKASLENCFAIIPFLNVYSKIIFIKCYASINKKSQFRDGFCEQPISVYKASIPSSPSWWAGWATRLWTLKLKLYKNSLENFFAIIQFLNVYSKIILIKWLVPSTKSQNFVSSLYLRNRPGFQVLSADELGGRPDFELWSLSYLKLH